MKKFYIFAFLALIAVAAVGFVLTADNSNITSSGPVSKKSSPGKSSSSENFKF